MQPFILVSPGPVDGYPPVQYQAKLLASAGYAVEIVTSPLSKYRKGPGFSYPGVRVSSLTVGQAFSGREKRIIAYCRALFAARLRAGRQAIEISYDPIGLFISDLTPLKPQHRIAHFHELLQYPESFLERRLKRSIRNYDLVMVPDTQRGLHTETVLDLTAPPLVIENYPMRANESFKKSRAKTGFEVAYAGALGFNQKLDMVIRSMPAWPDDAHLVLIGDATTKTAQALKDLAIAEEVLDRVEFTGWVDVDAAERRLACADLGLGLLDTGVEQLRTALGASNKRFQYMKAALPQIGDGNPGVRELLEGNGIGACVADHQPAELAALVCAYASDPARCREEGERAFELHQREFNYEQVFQRLLSRIGNW